MLAFAGLCGQKGCSGTFPNEHTLVYAFAMILRANPDSAFSLPPPSPRSGIVVYGIEYFYGGGVQASKPEDVSRAYGMRPAEVIDLGKTQVDRGTFEDFLDGIKGRYTQATYNLMVRQMQL